MVEFTYRSLKTLQERSKGRVKFFAAINHLYGGFLSSIYVDGIFFYLDKNYLSYLYLYLDAFLLSGLNTSLDVIARYLIQTACRMTRGLVVQYIREIGAVSPRAQLRYYRG